jgi:acetyl esterase/lipase
MKNLRHIPEANRRSTAEAPSSYIKQIGALARPRRYIGASRGAGRVARGQRRDVGIEVIGRAIIGEQEGGPAYHVPMRIMLPGLASLLLLASIGSPATAQSSPPNTLSAVEQKEGFELLFDGKSLDKFVVPANQVKVWRVVDGVIRNEQTAPGATILTKEDFGNFVLRAEFRAHPGVNSALMLRQGRPQPAGYELQIRDKILTDRTGGEYLTGSIVNVAHAPEGTAIVPNQWNTFEATLTGDHIVVSYNGAKVIDVRDSRRSTGAIGLQSAHPEDPAGAFIEFRSLKIKRLPAAPAQAQNAAPILQEPQTIRLWEGRAPGALGDAPEDVPTLTIYMPPNTTGPMTAVIVAPGGGYRALSMNKEGRIPANYLNSLGVAAFVLKYRLGPRYHHPIELGDMQRAIRLVRSRAAEWHIAPEKIGVMGFSAGGHLASTVSTHFDGGSAEGSDEIDRTSSRPNFAILGYPVISLTEAWTHQGSRVNLLGEKADPELARRLSTDTQVTSRTPPTFLFHTNADTGVPAENSVHYFLALRKAGVPAEMHIFKDGAHGAGMPMNHSALSEWPKVLGNWMRASGFL